MIVSESLQKRRATSYILSVQKEVFCIEENRKNIHYHQTEFRIFRYSIKGGFKFINKGKNVLKGILTLK